MKSSDKWYTGSAVLIGVILLWLLLHKSGAIAAGSPFSFPPGAALPPRAPNVNYQINFPTGAVNGVSNPTPSCGCDGGNNLFASIGDLIKNMTGKVAKIEESYFQGILASLPVWFSQNLNNIEGAYASGAAVNLFNTM